MSLIILWSVVIGLGALVAWSMVDGLVLNARRARRRFDALFTRAAFRARLGDVLAGALPRAATVRKDR